jgi:hypothetical protein
VNLSCQWVVIRIRVVTQNELWMIKQAYSGRWREAENLDLTLNTSNDEADFEIIDLTFETVIVRKLSRFLIHICRDVHSRPSKCRIWRSVVLSHLINITDKILLKTFKKNRYITSPSMCLSLFWLNWYENELFGHNSPYYLNTIWKLNNLVCSKTLFAYLDANQCKWCIRFLKIVI